MLSVLSVLAVAAVPCLASAQGGNQTNVKAGIGLVDANDNAKAGRTVVPAGAPPGAAEPGSTPARATQPTSSGSGSTVTYLGLGVATVLAAGSVFFTVKAAGTAKDFDAKKGELGVSRGDLDD